MDLFKRKLKVGEEEKKKSKGKEPVEEYNQSMSDMELNSEIRFKFQESLSSMSKYHDDWRKYDNGYRGQQWDDKRASWKFNPTVNYIAYVIDQKVPQLTISRPKGILIPQEPGDDDAVKAYTEVCDAITDRVGFDTITKDVVTAGLKSDIGWYYVYWNNSLKGGKKEKGNLWVGDVEVEEVDPTNIYVDPQATCVKSARYIIYAVPKTTQWVKDNFGVDVEPDEQTNFQTEIYYRFNHLENYGRVMFFAYWYRKDNQINVVYMAGDKIIKHIKGVYKHGQYPFVPFVSTRLNKSIIGIGEARKVYENQKVLNKLVEMPIAQSLLTANPIALLNKRSGIKKEKWVSMPGMVWEIEPNSTGGMNDSVKYLEPPQMSNDIYKLTENMIQYIEKIGGVYDAVTGNTPSGVTAAAAIQLLQEQGSIPIKGTSENLYSSITEVYKLMIGLIKEFYTEDRYVRIMGENGKVEFVRFNANDYGDVNFDVKVSAGPSTPLSRAYIAQLGGDLFAQGIITPAEYVEMQENLPNKEAIVERLKAAEGQAQQQAMQQQTQQPMEQPMQQQPMSLDDLPPQIQEQIAMMVQNGASEQEIQQALMQMLG